MSADRLPNEQHTVPNFELVAASSLLGRGNRDGRRSDLPPRECSPLHTYCCLHSGAHPLRSTSGKAAEPTFSDLSLFIEETKLRLTRTGREEYRSVILESTVNRCV